MKKDVINKLDIYKLKTSEELLKYYQNWTDKNQLLKDTKQNGDKLTENKIEQEKKNSNSLDNFSAD